MKKIILGLFVLAFTLSFGQCKDIENKIKQKGMAAIKAKIEKKCKTAPNKQECFKKEVEKYKNLIK